VLRCCGGITESAYRSKADILSAGIDVC